MEPTAVGQVASNIVTKGAQDGGGGDGGGLVSDEPSTVTLKKTPPPRVFTVNFDILLKSILHLIHSLLIP
jgi:hypothetical protein